MITGPQRLVFDDWGHSVTVGNSTSSIGNVAESKIVMTGSSIQTAIIEIGLIHFLFNYDMSSIDFNMTISTISKGNNDLLISIELLSIGINL